jgi:hypothetical protein
VERKEVVDEEEERPVVEVTANSVEETAETVAAAAPVETEVVWVVGVAEVGKVGTGPSKVK